MVILFGAMLCSDVIYALDHTIPGTALSSVDLVEMLHQWQTDGRDMDVDTIEEYRTYENARYQRYQFDKRSITYV